jgi:hypothetical protein
MMEGPESWRHLPAGFGDRVRIRPAPETEAAAIAGRSGIVYGITTVSVTGVEVIGTATDDVALNVVVDESNQSVWLAPGLVEFLGHDPGAAVTLQGVPKKWTRDTSGNWVESSRPLPAKEWSSWLRGMLRKWARR